MYANPTNARLSGARRVGAKPHLPPTPPPPEETTLALQVIRHVATRLHGQRGDESVVIYLDGSDNDIAGTFFVAINDLATELISRPATIKAAYAKLPATVRADFERKSGIQPPS